MRHPITAAAAACAAIVLFTTSDVTTKPGERWPQFRGPESLGIADGAEFPEKWSAKENVAWSVDVPGRGWSSPVVWDDKIFLTTALSGDAWKEPTTGIYGNDYIAELRKQGLSPEEVSRRVRARDNETPEELTSDVEWRLLCFDARNGKKLWDAELHRGKPKASRSADVIARTPTRPKRPSPTAAASTSTSGTSASSRTRSTASATG
jgi:outer membrane protein assembly factor BamB